MCIRCHSLQFSTDFSLPVFVAVGNVELFLSKSAKITLSKRGETHLRQTVWGSGNQKARPSQARTAQAARRAYQYGVSEPSHFLDSSSRQLKATLPTFRQHEPVFQPLFSVVCGEFLDQRTLEAAVIRGAQPKGRAK